MTRRREVLKLLAMAVGAFGLLGHAPYRQWVVYRAERLMIVASRQQPEAFPLTEMLAGDLLRAIPDSKPEAARTPSVLQLSRLIDSRQIEVAVLTAAQARAVNRGEGESAPNGAVPLRVLAILREPFVLVSHPEFDRNKAYLVLFGLFDEQGSLALSAAHRDLDSVSRAAAELGIPLHVGARDFLLELAKGG